MKIDKKLFIEIVKRRLHVQYLTDLKNASEVDKYRVVSQTIMNTIADCWMLTKEKTKKQEAKQMFYFSAEFLIGRAMSNNLINMLSLEDIREICSEIGIDYNKIEEIEQDAGLGNGGLGRLAACFLDSLATLNLPGHGYGIRYRFGMFKQKFENGVQMEEPDNWLKYGDSWSIEREAERVVIKFYGEVNAKKNDEGREVFFVENTEDIVATPYDFAVTGYGTDNVNTLRLWDASSKEGFNLQLFNDQEYLQAMAQENSAEDISRVLYPNDTGPSGKELRLKQQYFFSSASLQDILRNYKKQYGANFAKFADKVAVQLNDTHPVVSIPELMRILMDEEGLSWEFAWRITTKVFGYTNHTIMAEALEKWPIDMFSKLLPRIYQIIEEINRRFLKELEMKYPKDWNKKNRMSIVANGLIHMAWLAIVGSHSVNGVAALHTELLKNEELKEWFELYPKKFNNKTNGVTQRRWLLLSNPRLANFITSKIGNGWITNLDELKKLEAYVEDTASLEELMQIKFENKKDLAKIIYDQTKVTIDPNSIFDVQIKRLHEYKRQLLNALHIIDLYNRLKENPDLDIAPRTFIFGAKAASGYRRAKSIIKLINNIAKKINNDADTNHKLKVVFLENYNVSLAQTIFPASDVSEQISTASKEASGTGNMKFMMNGALTIGTMDGANVEIVDHVGRENAFIFGLTAADVVEYTNNHSYHSWDEYENNPDLAKVLEHLNSDVFCPKEPGIFRELYDSLLHGVEGNIPDPFFVLKDFAEYKAAQAEVDVAYHDKLGWAKKSLINIANSGFFTSDRTIQSYADEIWNIKPIN
ncbi:MAG: glycogen/starch/alpha-glucan phosphorylase [Fusobacteria bacterium]|nr:glycogen/starch/alpha-glucan phosphorylase [Fusobacteriota bacterium]